MQDLERAIDLAVEAHRGQKDRAGDPYIRHPLRVMEAMDTDHERIVAVLHDVVEDSSHTPEDVSAQFDQRVEEAVRAVTKARALPNRPDDESYIEFIDRAAKHPVARKVKLADVEDNLDLTRLESIDDNVLDLVPKYHAARERLLKAEADSN